MTPYIYLIYIGGGERRRKKEKKERKRRKKEREERKKEKKEREERKKLEKRSKCHVTFGDWQIRIGEHDVDRMDEQF